MYADKLRSLTLERLGRELFYVAKRNSNEEQYKINAIYEELVRRDKAAEAPVQARTIRVSSPTQAIVLHQGYLPASG
jgi:hypothetical protein